MSDLVGNPEDRFSHNKAQVLPRSTIPLNRLSRVETQNWLWAVTNVITVCFLCHFSDQMIMNNEYYRRRFHFLIYTFQNTWPYLLSSTTRGVQEIRGKVHQTSFLDTFVSQCIQLVVPHERLIIDNFLCVFKRSENKKNVYPCKPQFCYIKVGCRRVYVHVACWKQKMSNLCY